MTKTLLLGNGINRLTDNNSISWQKVLSDLADESDKKKIMQYSEYKPFTLIYEEIMLRSQIKERDLKVKVAEKVNELGYNTYHTQIMDRGFEHILTTNYDYCLEDSTQSAWKSKNMKRETRYSVYRRTQVEKTFVWHIHGESNKPRTIMLGHEQYCGYLQKFRDYIIDGFNKRNTSNASPFIQGKENFDTLGKPYSWVDLFLRDDVTILGLGFDYTEIDLWWLLTYKARLQKDKKYNVGKTEYYLTYNDTISEKDKAKQSLLESMGVKVIPKNVKGEWAKAYETIIKKL
jgi:hypothetical protein